MQGFEASTRLAGCPTDLLHKPFATVECGPPLRALYAGAERQVKPKARRYC
jgi:hypothetical protein